jgi:CBS domain-containing protein
MRRWLVSDVMTKDVVAVGETAPYKEIVETLARSEVSAVPVVDAQHRVVGVVSEADLLHKVEHSAPQPYPEHHAPLLDRRRRRAERAKADADTARELMSSPAVVIGPGASLSTAAKAIVDEKVKRLPVVDESGRLVGIVARSDLLRIYLRPDEAIRNEVVDQVLARTLWIEPDSLSVSVDRGVVTLAGTVDRRSTVGLVKRLVAGVAGVVEVANHLTYRRDDTPDLRRRRVAGPPLAFPKA